MGRGVKGMAELECWQRKGLCETGLVFSGHDDGDLPQVTLLVSESVSDGKGDL